MQAVRSILERCRRLRKVRFFSLGVLFLLLFSQPVRQGQAAAKQDTLPPNSSQPAFEEAGAEITPAPEPSLPIDLHLPVNSQTGQAAVFLLPDLRSLPPFDLKIRRLGGGRRELRLGNTIWNSGEGPMELIGELNPLTRQTRVLQRVFASDGSAHARYVGEFVFHPTHDHWHFEGFALYELWSLAQDGGLERVLSSSDKLSYCLIDTDPLKRGMPQFSAQRIYAGCGRQLQGLSPGWGDTYKSSLDGQSLDITGVADGYYALKSTTNPQRYLYEANYSNNSAVLYIEIRVNKVSTANLDEIIHRVCPETGIC